MSCGVKGACTPAPLALPGGGASIVAANDCRRLRRRLFFFFGGLLSGARLEVAAAEDSGGRLLLLLAWPSWGAVLVLNCGAADREGCPGRGAREAMVEGGEGQASRLRMHGRVD